MERQAKFKMDIEFLDLLINEMWMRMGSRRIRGFSFELGQQEKNHSTGSKRREV